MNDKKAAGTGKARRSSERRTATASFDPFVSGVWLDFMSDRAKFAMKRIQHDLEWQRAILSCRTPMDVMTVHSEFVRVAMEQYTEELGRLWAVFSRAGEDIASEARASHARGYDDVPL